MVWKIIIALMIALGLFAWAVYQGAKGVEADEHHRH